MLVQDELDTFLSLDHSVDSHHHGAHLRWLGGLLLTLALG